MKYILAKLEVKYGPITPHRLGFTTQIDNQTLLWVWNHTGTELTNIAKW